VKLPDGGANVRRRLQHLNQQLEALGSASCSASCGGGDSVQDSSSSTAKSEPHAKDADPNRDGSSSPRSLSVETKGVPCPSQMKASATSIPASERVLGSDVPVGRDPEDNLRSHPTSSMNRGAVLSARDEARAASGSAPSQDLLRRKEVGMLDDATHSANHCQSAGQGLTLREAAAAVDSAGVREGTTADEDRPIICRVQDLGFGLLSPRLAAAVGTPLPEHRAGGVEPAEQIPQLQHKIKLLKTKLELDAAILQDPIKREHLPDRGAKVWPNLNACSQEIVASLVEVGLAFFLVSPTLHHDERNERVDNLFHLSNCMYIASITAIK
jgi:hypothetical protein